MHIIGITGYKRAGKDILAQPLIDAGFLRLKFAAPMKNMLRLLLYEQNVEKEMVERIIEGDMKDGPKIAELGGHTSRWAQQSIGTEWGRTCMGEDFWVGVIERKIARMPENVPGVVITDVRFPNEAGMINRNNGLLARVNRKEVTPMAPADLHPSERYIEELPADVDVYNDAGLDDFKRKAHMHWANIGVL